MTDTDHDSDSEASFHSLPPDDEPPLAPQPTPPHPPRRKPPPPTNNAPSPPEPTPTPTPTERFPPAEEAALVAESHALKTSGNTLFGAGSYENALQTYDRALASCPNYLDFELAVLRSNVAACNLKLQAWKDAVAAADLGVEALERVEPLPVLTKAGVAEGEHGGVVAEIDDAEEARIEALRKSGRTVDEVRKLQVKLLLRRAKARTELGGWSNLQGAEEDYRTLLAPAMGSFLSATDRRGAAEAARKLGPRLNEAKEREMGEMMDKLKGLGNSLLKPFGMSTENFQFVKDEKTGGYSMNFNQNPAKK